MQAIENNALFSEVSAEESATVSGGSYFDLQKYIFGLGAALLFGNPGVTTAEVQYVWEKSLSL